MYIVLHVNAQNINHLLLFVIQLFYYVSMKRIFFKYCDICVCYNYKIGIFNNNLFLLELTVNYPI